MNERVVLITGGASGIGWAAAQEFAGRGCRVIIGDVDQSSGESAAASDPDRISAIALDVRDAGMISSAIDTVERRFGRLDILVNNAGIQKWTALANMDWDTWTRVLDVNLNGVVRCMSLACPLIEKTGGAVVNVVSIAAERGVPMRAPYSASKAAVIALTRSAAIEWADRGIRVNAVGPGYVATELIADFVKSGKMPPGPILERIPMGRFADPAEIARVIRFLASDEASYVWFARRTSRAGLTRAQTTLLILDRKSGSVHHKTAKNAIKINMTHHKPIL
jgi:3-oxoacyl-[acyl-carrier protein] reductase